MAETEQEWESDCSTVYAILDELDSQLHEALEEIDVHIPTLRQDIEKLWGDLDAVQRTKRLVEELIDPRDSSDRQSS